MANKLWVVVAAAGSGSRFSTQRAKQFFPLAGVTVAEVTLQRLLAMPFVAGVVVVRALADRHWSQLSLLDDPRVVSVGGGASRALSVQAGLQALAAQLQPDDWVLVHDIARPCVRTADIAKLIDEVADHPVGGLLASPVVETLKRVADGAVAVTCPRQHYALAQTPQLFRFGLLQRAVAQALAQGVEITDEASALEAQGLAVKVVNGRADNIKITYAEQLAQAQAILTAQQQETL